MSIDLTNLGILWEQSLGARKACYARNNGNWDEGGSSRGGKNNETPGFFFFCGEGLLRFADGL